MAAEFTTMHAVTLIAIGVLNLVLAVLVSRIRPREDVLPLAIFLGGIAAWTIPQGFLLVESDPTVGFVLAKAVDSGAVVMSTGLFHFAMAYSGRTRWLERRRLAVVYLVTAGWVVLTWTNPAHGLMHEPTTFTTVLLPIEAYQTPVYWLYVLYNWGLSGAGIYVFAREYLDARGSGVYHKQARLVVLAPLIPGVTNVFAHTELTAINYSVWGFGATGALIALALYRYRWLDLVPIARDSVIEGMRDGYLVVDDERRIVDLNPAARALLGEANVVGNSIDDVLPECRPLLWGDEQATTLTRNDAVITASVSRVKDDRTDGLVLMLRDVTEQRRAEKRFQALIENVSDVVTVVDESGTITYASPSVRTVTGYEPDAIVGTALLDLVHDDDQRDAAAAFDILLEHPGDEPRFEYRVRHRDGSWIVFEGVAANLLENDIVGGIVINSRDVTERNERERELERTNRRLDEFAGVLSHDLRTPLHLATTYARLAEETADRDDFQALEDAHERMEKMITSLLTMARTGTTLEEPAPVAVMGVVERAWAATPTGEATLECELEPRWTVVGDRTQLLHCFENLFRNAVEHNDVPVTVRVRHPGNDPDSGFVVEDDGVGIPPEMRDLVFERGHTTSEGGTGFGLAIVRDVIEAHGWQVALGERAGGGARFDISVDERVEAGYGESANARGS
ncbi:histidine kinase N-terminal 7TM domain-containing protein [Natrialbaceae archaeon A-CW3]